MSLQQIKPVTVSPQATASGGAAGDNGFRIATGARVREKYIRGRADADGSVTLNGTAIGDHSVEGRRALARKQAMHIVSDAFGSERAMDKNMSGIRDEIRRLGAETGALKTEQNELSDKLAELRAKYGIEEGSEEETGLRAAVMKVNYSENGMSGEEYEALSAYQKEALFYAATSQKNGLQIAMNEAAMTANVQAHTDLESERLKSHGMIDAQKNAEEVMEAAEKDAISQLTQEAVAHIDEKTEEEQEAAKEKAEEDKEAKKEAAKKAEAEAIQQETIARIRESASETERAEASARKDAARRARTEADGYEIQDVAASQSAQALSQADTQAKVSSEVTNILNKLSLLTEDIKGMGVDGQI